MTPKEMAAAMTRALDGDHKWPGRREGVLPADGLTWTEADPERRAKVQALGERYGCHICNRRIEDNPQDQSWHADHQPPVGLTAAAVANYALPAGQRRLFPQCQRCSSAQAVVMRKVAARAHNAWPALTAADLQLLQGHPRAAAAGGAAATNSIVTNGTAADAAERAEVQRLGQTFGCHTCPSTVPVRDYEVDHCPAVSVVQMSYMRKLREKLGIAERPIRLFPACPSCQRSQGGQTKSFLDAAATYCKTNHPDIPVYR